MNRTINKTNLFFNVREEVANSDIPYTWQGHRGTCPRLPARVNFRKTHQLPGFKNNLDLQDPSLL